MYTNGSERDFRSGHFYDPAVRGFDSYFLLGDTADLLLDTVKGILKIGDSGLVGSASSIPQFLQGDFEFNMKVDCLSPDSNDSEKYWGLRNLGDTLQRGAAYFNLSYDTTAGDSSDTTRPFSVVAYSETGTRYRRFVQWDSAWDNGANTRYRILWEPDRYTFLVNDTVVATIGEGRDSNGAEVILNRTIPQAIRISNRSLDTTDTSVTSLKFLNIRNAKVINWKERL